MIKKYLGKKGLFGLFNEKREVIKSVERTLTPTNKQSSAVRVFLPKKWHTHFKVDEYVPLKIDQFCFPVKVTNTYRPGIPKEVTEYLKFRKLEQAEIIYNKTKHYFVVNSLEGKWQDAE